MQTRNSASEKARFKHEIEAQLAKIVWVQLYSMGLLSTAEEIDLGKVAAGLPDMYHRWLDETFRLLVIFGYLETTNEGFKLVQVPTESAVDDVWAQWNENKKAWVADPDFVSQVALVEATLKALPEILTGKCLATDIIFKDAAMDRVEGVYKDNEGADFFNTLLAESVVACVEEIASTCPGKKVRILEVGAGTGGTSAVVLQKLAPYQEHIEEYCYTDLSKAFLNFAEENYGPSNPFLTYQLFNIEQGPAAQNIKKDFYDIVIATNVLHATHNIRRTLRNVKETLSRQGLLMLNEVSEHGGWMLHLTFGLLKGWWMYEDDAIRIPGCPGLYPQAWQKVLIDEGFPQVVFPAEAAHDQGQTIVIAQSDGMSREKSLSKTSCKKATNKKAEHKNTEHKSISSQSALPQKQVEVPVSQAHVPAVSTRAIEEHARTTIRAQLASFLRLSIDDIDDDEPFADYGLDSIIGINLVQELNKVLSIEMDTTVVFDYSSVNALADFVIETYQDIIRQLISSEDEVIEPVVAIQTVSSDSLQQVTPKTNASPSPQGVNKAPIAIVGMAGRFSQSDNVQQLWEHLAAGDDLVDEVSRWDLSAILSSANPDVKSDFCKHGSFIDGIDKFDALFFNISGVEANYMDPKQRLFLEECWHALEDAGHASNAIKGMRCGVYVGCESSDYSQFIQGAGTESPPPQATWGVANSVVPARIAYFLDLQGPAIAVDTACSSSLVATHLACQALWGGEIEMALSGGVAINPGPGIFLSSGGSGMLSITGRCHTFDARADGFVPGEGVGVLVLKRLQDALEQGDNIHGVIKGTGINQDGTTNGLTAPSARSQERLERSVYDSFGIDPAQIQMVEAHGTGTELGDPIEWNALTRSFRKHTDKQQFCAIGSIKSNIGHATMAAGVAGLLKILMSFKHRQMPPSLHFEKGNPNIKFESSPFFVNTELRDWPENHDEKGNHYPRCAAISAFGMSGTNVHMVLEEAPQISRQNQNKPAYLFVLSAHSNEQLRQQAADLQMHCEQSSGVVVGDVSFTLLAGRRHFNYRLAVMANNLGDLSVKLQKWLNQGNPGAVYAGVVNEKERRSEGALAQYGEHCIQQCAVTTNPDEYQDKLIAIAELFVQGYALDYSAIFNGQDVRRTSLPAYPFVKDSHWVPILDNTDKNAALVASQADIKPPQRVSSKSEVSSETEEPELLHTYEEVFLPQVLNQEHETPKRILCYLSNPIAQTAFARRLAELSPNTECLFIANADYLTELKNQWDSIDGFWYLQGLDAKTQGMETYHGLVDCLQGLHTAGVNCDRVLVASHWQADRLEACYSDAIVGLLRSLRVVLPHIQAGAVQSDASWDITRWADCLLQEQQADKLALVRYLSDERHISHMQPVAVNENTNESGSLKSGGHYLITGGLGGLGRQLAAFVARQTGGKLLLVGRSELSDLKRQQLQELRAIGGDVEYVAADISDLDALQALIQPWQDKWGGFNGLFHLAGNHGYKSLLENTWDDWQPVLAPKIAGTLALDELLKSDPLDFVCYFSSSSAALGDVGLGDYAVANRFQWAYSRYRKQQKLPGYAVCLAWPMWDNRSVGGGMQMGDEQNALYLRSSGQRALQIDEGLNLTLQAFNTLPGGGNLLVLAGKASRLARFVNGPVAPQKASSSASINNLVAKSEQGHIAHSKSAGAGWRIEMRGLSLGERVDWDLLQLTSDILQIDRQRLDVDRNLSDFGFDSISLAQFATNLSEHFGQNIQPNIFFSFPTLGQVREHFLQSFGVDLQAFYHQPVAATYRVQDSAQNISQPSTVIAEKHEQASISLTPNVTDEASRVLQKSANPVTSKRFSTPSFTQEPIAIIGMSGLFPGANDIDSFWEVLNSERCTVGEIPASRFDVERFFEPANVVGDDSLDKPSPNKMMSKWCGLIDDVSNFDALFFEVSPKEAASMDPRQRLLLQEFWKALEDAGYGSTQLKTSSVGVFVGAEQGEYQHFGGAQTVTANHDAVLASRLSYFLDLSGPAMALNTACSSGLVAAHQACLSLWQGDCDTALAGGVNLMLTPGPFIGMSQAGMLSPTGVCQAFGHGADGLVPGEAVVCVVLKRLSDAETDGDPIHAVISGSGINYDGKTNGITAPNGESQKALIAQTYQRFDIDVEDIGYVVAHGTGTKLGDPVEVNALSEVFGSHTSKQHYCALTSTKSNIGHTFAASGLVNLVTLVCALKHHTIPATLSSEPGNEHINWDDSAFYVNRHTKAWELPEGPFSEDKTSVKNKRMGALSSFGMSGTNAHMVVSEYVPEQVDTDSTKHITAPSYLLTLSAKHPDSLLALSQQLSNWLATDEGISTELASISHTLLNGRQHFAYRLALSVQSHAEAQALLAAYGRGERLATVHEGEVSRRFRETEAMQDYGRQLLENLGTSISEDEYHRSLQGLSDLYVQGYRFDWGLIYANNSIPQRVHLPTYAFLNKSHWVGGMGIGKGLNVAQGNLTEPAAVMAVSNNNLHPLVHSNRSTLDSLHFTSFFSGEEFFFKDHVVHGERVLPGVAYLEMARAALNQLQPATDEAGWQLSNIIWLRPLTAGSAQQARPTECHLYLDMVSDTEFHFEVVSVDKDNNEVVHCQGRAQWKINEWQINEEETKDKAPKLDVGRIREDYQPVASDIQSLYAMYAQLGLHYGAGHQGMQGLFTNNEARNGTGQGEVWVSLALPDVANDDSLALNPCLLDSALQGAIALQDKSDFSSDGDGSMQAQVPFALESVQIIHPCKSNMWARIQSAGDTSNNNQSKNPPSGNKSVRKLNIDLCDTEGNVCVRLGGFSARVLGGEELSNEVVVNKGTHEDKALATVHFERHWEVIEPLSTQNQHHQHQWWVDCSALGKSAVNHETGHNNTVDIQTQGVNQGERFAALVTQLTIRIQEQLQQGRTHQIQIIVPDTLGAGLSGFIHTIMQEHSGLQLQLVMVEAGADVPVVETLLGNIWGLGSIIAIRDGKAYRPVWSELAVASELTALQESQASQALPLVKDKGIYLITGGSGGIGLVMAKAMIEQAMLAQAATEQTTTAQIILVGRSALSQEKQASIEALGPQVHYRQGDISNGEDVQNLIHSIQQEFGSLNGILHAAGVLNDGWLRDKTEAAIQTVLAPKVLGSEYLDAATAEMALDYFVLFSSGSGVFGNAGQSDYAAANGYLDAFAQQRQKQVESGQRQGQTLSIDWPLWMLEASSGEGMSVDDASAEMMRQSVGMEPLPANEGVAALQFALQFSQENSVSQKQAQVLVVYGQTAKVRSQVLAILNANLQEISLQKNTANTEKTTVDALDKEQHQELNQRILADVLRSVATLLDLEEEFLDADAEFSEYGFDSITLTEFANDLNRTFVSDNGGLNVMPTVFFEYPTLLEFSDHLASEYTDVLLSYYQMLSNDSVAEGSTSGAVEKKALEFTVANSHAPQQSTVNRSRRGGLRPSFQISATNFANTPVTAQESVSQSSFIRNHDIAVIGMSARFPQAADVNEFWDNLRQGRDCIKEIPASRWDWQAWHGDPHAPGNQTNIKWGGFIEDVEKFDPLFFGISPREAVLMDPHQRLLMEYVWLAIEDAGYAPSSLSGSDTGLFVGIGSSDYNSLVAQAQLSIEGVSATSSVPSVGPNRMSYMLNLHGPSEPIETACSSSLVAVHRAVTAIRAGHCTQAIVGGVNCMFTPMAHISFSKAGMLAEDGRCKTFSANANGYVRGEGVGMVFLKPLVDAKADSDAIYGVIKGSAENHGGRANSLTSPNPKAQAALIVKAVDDAGIPVDSISYIETHGTGTELGDPIEINGLKSAFSKLRGQQGAQHGSKCALGSVKTNLGHLELAAGVAGLIKVLLQLRHKELVPTLHSEPANPYIDFADSGLYVVGNGGPWDALIDENGDVIPRRAGVSSFGFGGANAHIVVEEYIDAIENKELRVSDAFYPIALSSKYAANLKGQIENLRGALKRFSNQDLPAISATLMTGRDAMEYRQVWLVNSLGQLNYALSAELAGEPSPVKMFQGSVRKNQKQAGNSSSLSSDAVEIAQAWIEGVSIDWQLWFDRKFEDALEGKPRKLNLPGYAFSRDEYWPYPFGANAHTTDKPQITEQVQVYESAPTPEPEKRDLSQLNQSVNESPHRDTNTVSSQVEKTDRVGCQLFTPVWDIVPLISEKKQQAFLGDLSKAIIISDTDNFALLSQKLGAGELKNATHITLEQDQQSFTESLGQLDSITHVILLPTANTAEIKSSAEIIKGATDSIVNSFALIKALNDLKFSEQPLAWTVVTVGSQPAKASDNIDVQHAGLHGLFASLTKENPLWQMRLVDVDDYKSAPWHHIFSLPYDARGRAWAYRHGEWYRPKLLSVPAQAQTEEQATSPVYRHGGVYVIIGGAGGVGKLYSQWLIERYQARVIWLGRRAEDASMREVRESIGVSNRDHQASNRQSPENDCLEKLMPEYRQVDAGQLEALQHCIDDIKAQYGAIHGVINSALAFSAKSVAELDMQADILPCLNAKITTSVNISQVVKHENLDFLLYFSSIVALVKNPLQSHYAAACVFNDAFAHTLNKQWLAEGVSTSVHTMNWGFWNIPENRAFEGYQEYARLGIGMIEMEEGMQAVEHLLSQGFEQMGFMKTTKPILIEGMDPSGVMQQHMGNISRQVEMDELEYLNLSMEYANFLETLQQNADEVEKINDSLNQILLQVLWLKLQELPLFAGKGQYSFEQLQQRLDKRFGRWLKVTLNRLQQAGIIEQQQGLYTISDAPDSITILHNWQERKALMNANVDMRAQLPLLENSLNNLPLVLSGKKLATEVLFAQADTELVDGVYQKNISADYFNAQLSNAIEAYLKIRREDNTTPIRILEIGAGTGGTTAKVLENLSSYHPFIGEYCYTDISKHFLIHGENTFGKNNPFLTYKMFNIEQWPGEQEIDTDYFDIVIATNVIHATKNIRNTLRNVKATMRKDGILLLNEMNQGGGLFTHLTFGLLDGWWLFEDESLRIPGGPILSSESWTDVLTCEGFEHIRFPAKAAHPAGSQVVMAYSNGMVCYPVLRPEEQNQDMAAQKMASQPVLVQTVANDVSQGEMEDHVTQIIIEHLCTALQMKPGQIRNDDAFADYGLDSLVGVQFVKLVNASLDIDLATTVIYDYHSVERLAQYIVGEFGSILKIEQAQGSSIAGASITTASAQPSVSNNEETTKQSAVLDSSSALIQGKDVNARSLDKRIAVVGMSGRYAKSDNLHELWEHLAAGDDLVTEVSRWDLSPLYAEHPDVNFCRWGSFLDGIDEFDPLFFSISGAEATYTDPKQRVLLQECWHALEDAGYAGKATQEVNCGVYIGCEANEYAHLFEGAAPEQAFWGNSNSVLSARISYFLDLQGPAITMDTACSSSLVATHLACQSLWTEECDMAIAGGISMYLTPGAFTWPNGAGMFSTTGRCFTFDARADGFVPGEGVAVLVLKRLQDALNSRDHIYGVIKASGTNQDGATNGITAPSARSQERLEGRVYASCDLDPANIQMVEAHGTGTELGDPIEWSALTRSFRKATDEKQFCAIGSIKTNIGHATAAAGLSGVVKVLLSLQHRQMPPSLHFENGNPNIDFEASPFFVNTELRDWPENYNSEGQSIPRCAVVSAFGMSGTNAHVVLEQAPEIPVTSVTLPASLVVLSAKSEQQLQQQAQNLLDYCQNQNHSNESLANISFTLLIGRKHFNHRFACVAHDMPELIASLQSMLANKELTSTETAVFHVDCVNERKLREQVSLKNYARQCIRECQSGGLAADQFRNHIESLAELFVQGYALPYADILPQSAVARLPLPVYPFAKERYWVPTQDADPILKSKESTSKISTSNIPKTGPSVESIAKQDDSELLFFTEQWHSQSLAMASLTTAPQGVVVCFVGGQQRSALIEQLTQFMPQASIITVGDSGDPQASSEAHKVCDYVIDGQNESEFADILVSIQSKYGAIAALWYMWPLSDRRYITDCASIVHLLKAVALQRTPMQSLLLVAETEEDSLESCYVDSWQAFKKSLNFLLPDIQLALVHRIVKERQVPDMAWYGSTLLCESIGHQPTNNEAMGRTLENVRYLDNKRYVCRIEPQALHTQSLLNMGVQWQSEGCYLVTGGLGGIGLIMAEHLLKTAGVNVVLTGRSPFDAERQQQVERLRQFGPGVEYIVGDVSDRQQLQSIITTAKTAFGSIHGVLHIAGAPSQNILLQKDMAEFKRTTVAKIEGTLLLDELLEELQTDKPLDFVCYFSSSSAILGDFGNADYAIGNRFMQNYAHYRNAKLKEDGKIGHAIAINWPLWQDGGMSNKATESREFYLKSSGQRPLTAAEGVQVFEQLVADQSLEQVLLMVGDEERITRYLNNQDTSSAEPVIAPVPLKQKLKTKEEGSVPKTSPRERIELRGLSLEACILWDLKDQVSDLLQVPRDKLDIDTNLADFGFDSITLARFATSLSEFYSTEITPALFFAYPTMALVTEALLEQQGELLETFYNSGSDTVEVLGVSEPVSPNKITPELIATESSQPISPESVISTLRSTKPSQTPSAQFPIAIIGMSGRFPHARSVAEMWQNMLDGVDAVQEIPDHRFDWRLYYHPNDVVSGKMVSKWGGWIPGVAEFDAMFFDLTPWEAERMDPRQRLLLQESWKALEDAALGESHINQNTIGVFTGVEQGEYQSLLGAHATLTGTHEAILASRLAYFLNLDGPVLGMNTSCSSGLVAVHQACMSLRNGECDIAIASSANLLLSPSTMIGMSQAGMLSPEGKCFTFSKQADGMVPGEAIGALVLKPLAQAECDGDPIEAVILGSGINYDGKTNGITAPNGSAQSKLIGKVYQQYGFEPKDIGLLVSHGTGTRLGDPVEVNALHEVYKGKSEAQSIPVISTKSHLGHSFAASGMVSLMCLVQALKQQQIPASLHCDEPSDYINWNESPFFVNRDVRSWPTEAGKQRLGAVSAFGMSGTNAHMVVGEYQPTSVRALPNVQPCYLLTVSAKHKDALATKVQDLCAFLNSKTWSGQELAALSHTLLTGRYHFNYRCAIVVESSEEALYVWNKFGDAEKLPNMFKREVEHDFVEQIALKQYGQKVLQDCALEVNAFNANAIDKNNRYRDNLIALADLYTQGYNFEWMPLFNTENLDNKKLGNQSPVRLHLPTYPFIRKQLWLSPEPIPAVQAASTETTISQPAVTQSKTTQSVMEQSVSTGPVDKVSNPLHGKRKGKNSLEFGLRLNGDEFFLADHLVNNQPVLPGVAYLEMVRSLVAEAFAESLHSEQKTIEISHVVWLHPCKIDQGSSANLVVSFEQDKHGFKFAITDSIPATAQVYCQGRIGFVDRSAAQVNVQNIRKVCGDMAPAPDTLYNMLEQAGLHYGDRMRAIGGIKLGVANNEAGSSQALVELTLPESLQIDADSYGIHPTLLDSALQSSISLAFAVNQDSSQENVSQAAPQGAHKGAPLPFALTKLSWHQSCPNHCFAWIRPANNESSSQNALDVDLFDAEGNVCLSLQGFVSRSQPTAPAVSEKRANEEHVENSISAQKLVPSWRSITPQWLTKDITTKPCLLICEEQGQNEPAVISELIPNAQVLLLKAGMSEKDIEAGIKERFSNTYNIEHIVWLVPEANAADYSDLAQVTDQDQGVLFGFRLIKALLAQHYGARKMEFTIVTRQCVAVSARDKTNPTHASIHGLFGSLAKEYRNWSVRLIDIESSLEPTLAIWQQIFKLPWDPLGNAVAYRNANSQTIKAAETLSKPIWYQQVLMPCDTDDAINKPEVYRQNGLYVVIGGAGGIGEVWTEWVMQHFNAQVVWIGRRAIDDNIREKQQRLAQIGEAPVYVQADATDVSALQKAKECIVQHFPNRAINGVIHSAIVLSDKGLASMDEHTFKNSLNAKVAVSIAMARVFAQEPLDWMLFFSSLQSFTKEPGQSNYAAGCAFKDSYAHSLNQQLPCDVKTINWGYWGSVGIVSSDDYRNSMAAGGIGSIEKKEGMQVLHDFLKAPFAQMAVLKVTKPEIIDALCPAEKVTVMAKSSQPKISALKQRFAKNKSRKKPATEALL